MLKAIAYQGQIGILWGMIVVFAAGVYTAKSPLHLLAELRISSLGKETPAHVVNVKTVERDNGDRTWQVDLINYTFTTPEGYVFSGVNEANVSQTEKLIGHPDAQGRYRQAIVQYLPRNPKIHRLKGWGYDGYGPPGGLANFAIRGLIHTGILGFAWFYAYGLFTKRRNR